jgi:hypothetical protein
LAFFCWWIQSSCKNHCNLIYRQCIHVCQPFKNSASHFLDQSGIIFWYRHMTRILNSSFISTKLILKGLKWLIDVFFHFRVKKQWKKLSRPTFLTNIIAKKHVLSLKAPWSIGTYLFTCISLNHAHFSRHFAKQTFLSLLSGHFDL